MKKIYLIILCMLCTLAAQAEDGNTEPFLTVNPTSVSGITAHVGESKIAATFTVRQGNLGGPVSVELAGKDAAMFSIDKQSVSAAEENVTLTYKPTTTGSHTAYVYFDPTKNNEFFTMMKISANVTAAETKP